MHVQYILAGVSLKSNHIDAAPLFTLPCSPNWHCEKSHFNRQCNSQIEIATMYLSPTVYSRQLLAAYLPIASCLGRVKIESIKQGGKGNLNSAIIYHILYLVPEEFTFRESSSFPSKFITMRKKNVEYMQGSSSTLAP